ncbi:hypothetical protein [Arthrobacter castelli]|uniref:hypothetical protein n=1 Tax=Arthrobacter castelli TaxID=271431 RepID=UPI00042A126E|nr:hypothetical protein [Arthrobacter castelli]
MTDLRPHMRAITTELDRTTDTNSLDRVQIRTRLVFDIFYNDEPEEPGQAIRDVLTDLMHAGAERGVD